MGNRLQEAVQQQNIHHGHLVHNHGIRFQRVILVPDKDHLSGGLVDPRLQQAMDGGRILPRDLRQPFGRSPRGGGQQTFQLHLPEKG